METWRPPTLTTHPFEGCVSPGPHMAVVAILLGRVDRNKTGHPEGPEAGSVRYRRLPVKGHPNNTVSEGYKGFKQIEWDCGGR